jgi:predicted RNA-binding protein
VTDWCLTTSPDNFGRTAALGWSLQGLKSRRGPTARRLRPGDRITYYCTQAGAFGAVVEVTTEAHTDHEPIWVARQEGEDYPWRFGITPLVVIEDPAGWVPVVELLDELAHPRKWPPERWHLAFQGNIREWPAGDCEAVLRALQRSAVLAGGGAAWPFTEPRFIGLDLTWDEWSQLPEVDG